MSITLGSNFDLQTTLPLDARTKVADNTARDALSASQRYEGLIVYSVGAAKNYQLVGGIANANWIEVAGSGSGVGINYITNYTAENDTTGWAAYADAAGASPVDGTGGSPTLTFTRSTSSPLRGTGSFLITKDAANRQGEGASYAFTIDTADKAKMLQISCDYTVGSGTYSGGTSSTDSDLTCYIYDVTNAVVIQPAGFKLDGAVSGTNYNLKAVFQSSSSSSSYRLIFHVATTSASAYTMKIDNVTVSPIVYTSGAAMTDWQSYTPTFVGFGTVSVQNHFWRRVGDSVEISGRFTAGTPTAVQGTISLPAGLTSSSSIGTRQVAGAAARNSTGANSILALVEVSVTVITFGFQNASFAGFNTALGNTLLGVGDIMSYFAVIPIQGWSSNTLVSSSADTRVVAALITGDPASATVGNPIIVPTVGYDSHGAYNAATGRYTVQVPGIYKVFGALQSASAATTLTIYKNAASTSLAGNLDSNGEATFCSAVNCVAGDVIDIRPGGTVDATNMTLNFERLSGPSQIAASESVNARGHAPTTTVTGSLATVVWLVKDFDSHNGLSTSTGIYTVPMAGKYKVDCSLGITGTFALNSTSVMEIQVGSTTWANVTRYSGGAVTNEAISLSDIVSCVAGDTIKIQVSSSATSPALVSGNTRNYMAIARIGN